MVMKEKCNPYKNLKIWGSYSPEWLSECDHSTAQGTLFSLYWEFGLFSSPQAGKDWCGMAKVGERHLDCWRASVWPTLLSICIPNLLKQWESLLKDREIISWPEIMLPHTSYTFIQMSDTNVFALHLIFFSSPKRRRYRKHKVLLVGHGTGPVNYP